MSEPYSTILTKRQEAMIIVNHKILPLVIGISVCLPSLPLVATNPLFVAYIATMSATITSFFLAGDKNAVYDARLRLKKQNVVTNSKKLSKQTNKLLENLDPDSDDATKVLKEIILKLEKYVYAVKQEGFHDIPEIRKDYIKIVNLLRLCRSKLD